jgi:hypothetical protein
MESQTHYITSGELLKIPSHDTRCVLNGGVLPQTNSECEIQTSSYPNRNVLTVDLIQAVGYLTRVV